MEKNCLQIADELVGGDRNDDYGHPAHDFARTAKMWSAILGVEVSPDKVPLCMIAVKISRLCHSKKHDSIVDIAGYARTLELVIEYESTQTFPMITDDNE